MSIRKPEEIHESEFIEEWIARKAENTFPMYVKQDPNDYDKHVLDEEQQKQAVESFKQFLSLFHFELKD